MTAEPVPGQSPPPGCPAHSRARIYGEDFARDHAAVYERLRREYGDVAPVELAPGVPATLVLGYATGLDVLRSADRFRKDPRAWQGTVPQDASVMPMMYYRENMLNSDGAEHARLRASVTDSLDRVDLSLLRSFVETASDALIDEFGPSGKAELLGQYARSVAALVFNHLFGCPPAIGDRLIEGMRRLFDQIDTGKANLMLLEAVNELIALKRAQPSADVTSWMMAHPARLTDEELAEQLILLLGAGIEPQQNLIANTLLLLMSDDRFADDVSGGILPVADAIDEILWTNPPIANYPGRYPPYELDLAGTRLPANQPVIVSLPAANADPAVAAERRTGSRAHLAFSAGPHQCPAQNLSRLTTVAAIERLLDRLPGMTLAVAANQLTWRPGPFHHGLTTLPVTFPPVSASAVPQPSAEANPWSSNPAPSSSTSPAATSTAKPSTSPNTVMQRAWNYLVRWWHGQ